MKLTIFCLPAIVVSIWSCAGDFDEPTTTTLNESGNTSGIVSYLVGITMKKKNSNSTKDVELIVYRNNNGYPSCVGVSGFTDNDQYVKLKKYGNGEWKVNADGNAGGLYNFYRNAESDQLLDVTLHWTKRRGSIKLTTIKDPITVAKDSRLEYFSIKRKNGTLHEYERDVDGKSGSAIGELLDTVPSQNDFNSTCES